MAGQTPAGATEPGTAGPVTSGPGSTDFESIYTALVEVVREAHASSGTDLPLLPEPPAVAGQSAHALSRQALIGLPTDEEFARACFWKLLDRSMPEDQVTRTVGELRRGTVSRDAVIDRITGSEEFRTRNLVVGWV